MRYHFNRFIKPNPLNPPCATEHGRPYDYLKMPKPVTRRISEVEKLARRLVLEGRLGPELVPERPDAPPVGDPSVPSLNKC